MQGAERRREAGREEKSKWKAKEEGREEKGIRHVRDGDTEKKRIRCFDIWVSNYSLGMKLKVERKYLKVVD